MKRIVLVLLAMAIFLVPIFSYSEDLKAVPKGWRLVQVTMDRSDWPITMWFQDNNGAIYRATWKIRRNVTPDGIRPERILEVEPMMPAER